MLDDVAMTVGSEEGLGDLAARRWDLAQRVVVGCCCLPGLPVENPFFGCISLDAGGKGGERS